VAICNSKNEIFFMSLLFVYFLALKVNE
jgi:hypothetical protein